MFKSKSRQIITPQSEHLKLVGTLAMFWGNDQFDAPPIERESMILGMGLHDRGYGYLDNAPIGGMRDEEWQDIARHGFHMDSSDAVADAIIKYHIRRLAGYGTSDIRKALHAEFDQGVAEHLKRHNLSRLLFDRMDRITDLLDHLSFEFCFDAPASGSLSIFPRNDGDQEVTVEYHIENGEINVSPWPFSVDEHRGYLIAYQTDGYPERLDPVLLPYHLKRK